MPEKNPKLKLKSGQQGPEESIQCILFTRVRDGLMNYPTTVLMLIRVVVKKGLCKFLLNFFCFFCLLSCYSDPGKKKIPLLVRKVVSKSVRSSYNPAVDILFIVDDSDSMDSVQNLLAQNAEVFIDEFLGMKFIDYRIAVTTTSVGGGGHSFGNSVAPNGKLHSCDDLAKKNNYKYPNYVDRNTPDLVECFQEMVTVGTGGSIDEKFLIVPNSVFSVDSIYREENSKFYRPEAHLAIFIMTDADDQDPSITIEGAYDFLLNLKKGDEKKLHYALGFALLRIRTDQYKCGIEPIKEFPTKNMQMVELFGPRGYLFNLCQFNYGKNLAEFAGRLVDSVLTLPLSDIPDMDTLEVRYDYKEGSQVIPKGLKGWTYDVENNTIHLSRDIQLNHMGGKFGVKYESLYMFEPDSETVL